MSENIEKRGKGRTIMKRRRGNKEKEEKSRKEKIIKTEGRERRNEEKQR